MVNLLTALCGISIAVSYIFFIRGTLRGEIILMRSSWLVWLIQDALIFISAAAVGVGPALIMPAVWTCGASIMLYLAYTRGATEPFKKLDIWCLALGLAGTAVWLFTGSARTGMISSLASALIAGVPTTAKAWTRPWTDSPLAWSLQLTASVLAFFAIANITFDSVVLPLGVGAYQISTLVPLITYRFIDRKSFQELIARPQKI